MEYCRKRGLSVRLAVRLLLMVSAIVVLFSGFHGLLYGKLPELLPRKAFFNSKVKEKAKISPDGTLLAYLEAGKNEVVNVWITSPGKKDARMVSSETGGGVPDYYWAYDNRHILYLKDSDGDENFHVYAVDIVSKITRDLTPFKEAKAQNLLLSKKHPGEILVGLNRRDKRMHDMYRINIETGKAVLDTRNPGDVRWWLADWNFTVRAAVAFSTEDSSTFLRIRESAEDPWRDLIHWPFGETGLLEGYGSELALAFTPDGSALYVQAAFEGDQTQVAKVNATTGKVIEIVAKDARASIWNVLGLTLYDDAQVLFHPETGEMEAAAFNYLKPHWKGIAPGYNEDLKALSEIGDGVFKILSRDKSGNLWTVEYLSDKSSGAFYLYNRKTRKAELLFEAAPHMSKYPFAPMKGIIIKARDGKDIPCYLTTPVGIPEKKLPLLAFPHGGPWARDEWGFDSVAQFLANRGYAVLHINFRGSAGFGKKFLNAGNGQWGVGSMQQDITDAVKWCIKKGLADPGRVAVIGGSYGGYATLAGITFTPDLYTCAIDLFGISNVRTAIDTMPDWWHLIKKRWIRRIGSHIMTDESFNRRISPLFHADKIKAKLMIMHGANDPRVKIQESNRIVETMRKNKKEVVYVVYPDEGHGFRRPANLADMLSRIENFLAKHLGGRTQPPEKIPGSSAELR
jgi:dipeptidyl aminopeptidase/acylaminoacyl peptidase